MFKNFGKKEEPKEVEKPKVEKKPTTTVKPAPAPKAPAAPKAKAPAPAKAAPKEKAPVAKAVAEKKPSGRPGRSTAELKAQLEQYENEIAVLSAKADKKGSDLPAINEQISILNKKRRRLNRRIKLLSQ